MTNAFSTVLLSVLSCNFQSNILKYTVHSGEYPVLHFFFYFFLLGIYLLFFIGTRKINAFESRGFKQELLNRYRRIERKYSRALAAALTEAPKGF